MTMTIASALRIGGPLGSETTIDILKTELFHSFQTDSESSKHDPKEEKAQIVAQTVAQTQKQIQSLHVINKYFTADVQLIEIDKVTVTSNADNTDGDGNTHTDNHADAIMSDRKEDGILLVFPSNSIGITQMDALTEFHDSFPM